jgi:hypothetical protein
MRRIRTLIIRRIKIIIIRRREAASPPIPEGKLGVQGEVVITPSLKERTVPFSEAQVEGGGEEELPPFLF